MHAAARQDEIFRALADPTRRAIFEQLTRGESAVNALTATLTVSQPAVSQHLATLRKAGLVRERRDGRHAYYRVEREGLRPLVDWISRYQAFWTDRLASLKSLLDDVP